MFSFADINNYGDILFSHVFKMEILQRIPDADIDFYSPSEADIEGLNYIAYTKEKVNGKYDALILAGGEVIHLFDEKTWIPIYKKNNLIVAANKPSDIVWDWADSESSYKAWLSVGVRPFDGLSHQNKINKILEDLDYVSVRGIISKKILEHDQVNFYNPKIAITPDLGWLFPKFLNTKKEVAQHYKKYIPAGKYVIFQTNTITSEEARLIGDALVKFEQFSRLKVFLLPVIHPWEDEKYLRMIEASTDGSISMLPETLSTLEIADILLHAEVVLSSSLHSAITALAHGIPAAIINKWQGTKLQDLFGLQFRVEYLSNDFSDTYDLLIKLISEKKRNQKALQLYADFMKERLSEVFDELCENILIKSKKNI